MHDQARQPSGSSGTRPTMAIRSRSSANIRSAPNPRVPTSARDCAARYIIAMTATKESSDEDAPGDGQPRVRQPQEEEAEGQGVDESSPRPERATPAATTTGKSSALGTCMGHTMVAVPRTTTSTMNSTV